MSGQRFVPSCSWCLQQEQLQQAQRTELGDGAQTKLLKQRLADLQREIERFRHENVLLEKLRKEREDVRIALNIRARAIFSQLMICVVSNARVWRIYAKR